MMYFRVLFKSGIAAVIIAAIAVVIACNAGDSRNAADTAVDSVTPDGCTMINDNLNIDSISTITYVPLTNTYWVYLADDTECYVERKVAHRIMATKEHCLDKYTFQVVVNEDSEHEILCTRLY